MAMMHVRSMTDEAPPPGSHPTVVPDAMPRTAHRDDPITGQAANPLRVLIRRRVGPAPAGAAWVMEFEPDAEMVVRPSMGWLGSRVRLGGEQLEFPSVAAAMAFARQHGWS